MAPPLKWTDDEIVALVWDLRTGEGACTVGELAKATGMAKASTSARVLKLIEEGRLVTSSVVGSLRASDERMMQELSGGRLIERKAQKPRRALRTVSQDA